MSHHVTPNGRPYVECDSPVAGPITGPHSLGVARCGQRTFGRDDRSGDASPLTLEDLPDGWSVAPYGDGFDHGATRRSLIDGAELAPLQHLVGIVGDLHTCPRCRVNAQEADRG